MANGEIGVGRGAGRVQGRLRRLAALAAVVALAGGVVACGGDDEGGGDGGGGYGGGSENPAAQLDLKQSGELLVGAEFPVKGFVEGSPENPKGFEVDLAAAIAKQLKVAKVRWMNVAFSGLFSPAPKPFDMAINEISISPERQKVVDFSVPYFDANQGLLVNKQGAAASATTMEALKGVQFGFQAKTTGGDYIEQTIKPTEQPREYSTLGAASQALRNGQIDAFVMDVAISSEIAKSFPGQIALTGQFTTDEKYGALFQKGSKLRAPVDKAIQALEADGTLKRLQGKWFPGTEKLPVLSG